MLPPGNVKLRFFVPEPMLARIAIDDAVAFRCDGCPADHHRPISFISRYAEYTPPVIYSQRGAPQAGLSRWRRCRPDRRRCASASRSSVDVTLREAPEDERSRPDIAIDVHGLTKSFGGRMVVRDLSMQVKRGTIYGFLGPNGSGKTTTIRMLTGLLTPDKGEGTCLGYDIRTQADEIKLHVGYMTQRFSLYQDLSVRGESRIRRAALPDEKSGAGRARHDRAARA